MQPIHRFVGVLVAVIALCCSFSEGYGQTPDRVSKEKMLRDTVEKIIRPGYMALQSRCHQLEESAKELSTARSPENLKKAQHVWIDTMFAARKMQAYRIGPIADRESISSFYYWQRLPNRIESVIASSRTFDESFLDELGATTKGLFAIEYLLFDRVAVDETNSIPHKAQILGDTNAVRRCDLFVALATDLHHKADQLSNDWNQTGTESAAEKFVAGGQESLNKLVNQLAKEVEALVEDHVNFVLQMPSPVSRQLERIEGSSSGTSLQGLVVWLAGIHDFYSGTSGGIENYLRGLNGPLAKRVEQQFQLFQSNLKAVDIPLEEAVVSKREAMQNAYKSGRDLEILLKVDLASALGVTITFSSNDGD